MWDLSQPRWSSEFITNICHSLFHSGPVTFAVLWDCSTEALTIVLRCCKGRSINAMLTGTKPCFILFLPQSRALILKSSADISNFCSLDVFLACLSGSREHVDEHTWNYKKETEITPYKTVFGKVSKGQSSYWWCDVCLTVGLQGYLESCRGCLLKWFRLF